MGIRGNLPEGVLVRGNIIDRLRLALRLDNEWIYMSFNIEKIEGKPALTHVKVEVTDLKALEGVVDIEMEDQTIFKHGQS
ncbi:hypothetical protein F4212_08590 [Candidatus Poribacteria bacterium]|nr:hypothetical protein [Candidatus Poribacteria bacterium]